jgi:predicted DNA-binding antitoxin AbrB/MazE fold protein
MLFSKTFSYNDREAERRPTATTMTTQLHAVYENGVLRPLQPLDLAERQRVLITISPDSEHAVEAVDQTRFELSAERWEAFCALLDQPPRDIPELRALLTEPSILDDRRP